MSTAGEAESPAFQARASRTAFLLCNLLFTVLYTYTMQETTQTVTAAGSKNWRRECGFPSPSFCQRGIANSKKYGSLQTSERVHGKGFIV